MPICTQSCQAIMSEFCASRMSRRTEASESCAAERLIATFTGPGILTVLRFVLAVIVVQSLSTLNGYAQTGQAAEVDQKHFMDEEAALRRKLAASPNSGSVLSELAGLLSASGMHTSAIIYWKRAEALLPDNATIRLSLALELMDAGQNDEAVEELTVLSRAQPKSATVFVNLGAALSRTSRFQPASSAYTQAIGIDPTNTVALLSIAKAYSSLMNYDLALSYVRRYRSLIPDDFEGSYLEGFIERNLGKTTEAISALQQAVRIRPADYDAEWNLGAALLDAQEPKSAIEPLRLALEMKQKSVNSEAAYSLIRAYKLSGDIAEASAEAQNLRKEQDKTLHLLQLDSEARSALDDGKFLEAISIYQMAEQLNSNDANIDYDLAISYERAGLRTQEREALLAAEHLDPSLAGVENLLGLLDYEDGHVATAEQHYQRALAADPQYEAAISNLAVLDAQSGQLNEAQALLQLAVDLNPKNADNLRNLALVQAAQENIPEALTSLHLALQLSSQDARIWQALGAIQQQKGEVEQAVESLQHAVEYAPTSVSAHVALASACLAASDFACAQRESVEAIQLNPHLAVSYVKEALALCGMRQTDAAKAAWNKALMLDPSLPNSEIEGCSDARNVQP
jgi:tetratricopeptide (TPR) repeat protein